MARPTSTASSEVMAWFPARVNGTNVNKGSFGHVAVVGGSDRYPGAPILAAEASARSGAGKVSLVFPATLSHAIIGRSSPILIFGAVQTEGAGFFTGAAVSEVLSYCETSQASVMALGPGLGRSAQSAEFIRNIVGRHSGPLVLDADGLVLLSGEKNNGADLILERRGGTILTPHPGELAVLLSTSIQEIQSNRHVAVQCAVEKFRCVVVLKGFETLVASPNEEVRLNVTGNPGLATGGTGDVLTGIIAGLVAQGLELWPAAVTAVYLHGLAGDLACEKIGGSTGLIATDVITALPQAIAKMQSGT